MRRANRRCYDSEAIDMNYYEAQLRAIEIIQEEHPDKTFQLDIRSGHERLNDEYKFWTFILIDGDNKKYAVSIPYESAA